MELGRQLDLPTYVSSDAIAACSAELIYGLGSGLPDFAYLYVDHSLGGGLIQNGRIRFSRDAAVSGIGKVLVPGQRNKMVPLWTLAGSPEATFDDQALHLLARGIAHAVYSASAVIGCDVIIIDGSLPPEARRRLVVSVKTEVARLDPRAAANLAIREGTREHRAAGLGAACLPLVDRFFPETAIDPGANIWRAG